MVESTGQIAGLFGTYGERMREWANRILGSLQDAEDVVQEVMLVLLSAPHVLSGVENLGGWLYTLVRRRCNVRSKLREHFHGVTEEPAVDAPEAGV